MSVFLTDSSNDSAPVGLDIFSVPPNEVAVENRFFQDLRPVSQFNGFQSPIQFESNRQGNIYTDLSNTTLFLKVRILKEDGSKLDPDDKVSPVNIWFHSLFSQVDLYMNGSLVSSSGDKYPYNAYFSTLLKTGAFMDNSDALSSQIFYKDTYGALAETNPNAGNYGLFKRHSLSQGSQVVDMFGCILSDCMQLDRYLINGVNMRLVLTRSRPEFCLLCHNQPGGRFQVVIEDAFLRLTELKINPAIIVAHNNIMKSAPARYPFTRRTIKCANIPANQNVFVWDNIITSYIPRFMLVAFCDSDAVLGSYNKNPWNFKHYDLTRLTLFVNGVSCPASPITPRFGGNDGTCVMEVYEKMVDYFQQRKLPGFNISRNDIASGYALYFFNISPQLGQTFHFSLQRTGTVRLDAQFGTPLPETTTCIIYSEWDSAVIEIDESRNIAVK